MSNTYSVTLPDGQKVLRTSVRNFSHAVAYRDTVKVDETGAEFSPWTLSGFRSSERLAHYQAGRLRNQGHSEVVVLPVDSHEEPAPVVYVQDGKLVDGFGNPTEENVPGAEIFLSFEDNLTPAVEELSERLSEEGRALDAALDAAVGAFLGDHTVSGRSWTKIRDSLRPAIVAASPHLQSRAWEVGYEDGTVDETLRDLIEAGAAQATVDPYLNGTNR